MKIAYFVDSLPPRIDGVSHSYINLFNFLHSGGIAFRAYSPFVPGNDYAWAGKVRKVVSIPFPLYTDYRVALPFLDNLFDDVSEFDPDIVHVSSPTFLGFCGLKYAARSNIPAVATHHTDFVSYCRYYGVKPLEGTIWRYMRWFFRRFSAVYVPSNSAASELKSRGISRVALWSRGIDTIRFSPGHRDSALRRSIGAADKPVLLFVGRLVKEKDLDDLVEASDILRRRGNDFSVVLVGDGPMREELRRRLPDGIFTGYLEGHDLARWYASADIFVFPSTSETFGNVVQEASASGIPSVVVRKGGVVDLVIDGESGFICEPNSPAAIADRVEQLMRDARLRHELGTRARLLTEKNSWDSEIDRLLKSYERVVIDHRAGVKASEQTGEYKNVEGKAHRDEYPEKKSKGSLGIAFDALLVLLFPSLNGLLREGIYGVRQSASVKSWFGFLDRLGRFARETVSKGIRYLVRKDKGEGEG